MKIIKVANTSVPPIHTSAILQIIGQLWMNHEKKLRFHKKKTHIVFLEFLQLFWNIFRMIAIRSRRLRNSKSHSKKSKNPRLKTNSFWRLYKKFLYLFWIDSIEVEDDKKLQIDFLQSTDLKTSVLSPNKALTQCLFGAIFE